MCVAVAYCTSLIPIEASERLLRYVCMCKYKRQCKREREKVHVCVLEGESVCVCAIDADLVCMRVEMCVYA
jgi:hypothetical protein